MNRIQQPLKLSLLAFGLTMALMQPASAAPEKAPELSKITYKYIQKAQEQMAEDNYSAAQESLEHVLSKVQRRKADSAAVNQMLGVVFANQEQFGKALEYFRAALKDDALHRPAAQQVRYNLAQLLMMQGEYKESISTLKTWMSNLDDGVEVPARAWIMLANNYSRLKEWKNVVEPAKKAVAATEKPPEAWYSLLLAAHYELKDYPSAVDVLETLVVINPAKKMYWLQLSGMNMSMKKDAAALSALRAAYRHGVFDKESDYSQLANFLTFRGIPYMAGVAYKEGMDRGVVEASYDNIKRLANYWSHARETDRAIEMFYKALAMDESADLQVRLARLLAQAERYDDLIKLVSEPAADISSKQKGSMLVMEGLAWYQLGEKQKSLNFMRKAAQIDSSKGQANTWIGFLEQDLNSK
ncbi:tetratricopeptide repeat protein [Parendozoicomonas haliclonae]|uniref:Photosystem I assembly protein Ycf3 n=1 Tax=Parendozoicomonas haliclonae TaxID=1960125 RepID=A0A1X7AIR2_9GAMM|nr:tetratricopeptide repeat protein [Parendozoicomonas haliclonae]SMA44168.1 photosystem I assembly protein Ycf3 [Parendozoicomonas haliclonae]